MTAEAVIGQPALQIARHDRVRVPLRRDYITGGNL
jgi:hypothetical protein